MSIKSVFSFAAWLTVVLVACTIVSGEGVKYIEAQGKRIIVEGIAKPKDTIFYSEQIVRRARFMRVISLDAICPPANYSNKITISRFTIRVKRLDGYGGFAYHTSGGVGFTEVGVHLMSRRNYGIDFNISLFGRVY